MTHLIDDGLTIPRAPTAGTYEQYLSNLPLSILANFAKHLMDHQGAIGDSRERALVSELLRRAIGADFALNEIVEDAREQELIAARQERERRRAERDHAQRVDDAVLLGDGKVVWLPQRQAKMMREGVL